MLFGIRPEGRGCEAMVKSDRLPTMAFIAPTQDRTESTSPVSATLNSINYTNRVFSFSAFQCKSDRTSSP